MTNEKATEEISCELRYYQGDISPEMLEVLKEDYPEKYQQYMGGDGITLCFELSVDFIADSPFAKFAPFFKQAEGYSLGSSTSNGKTPPMTSLFEAINLYIGK